METYKQPVGQPQNKILTAEKFAIDQGLKCTRCNSCKVCPVIDAEHQLERKKERQSKKPVLPSKRNILMFMERVAALRASARTTQNARQIDQLISATNQMFAQSAALLKKCFYCRKCDKACPVDINIHPLMRAYHKMGSLPAQGSKLWGFVYERLMGEDFFKAYTYKLLAVIMLISQPILRAVRKLRLIPDWAKTYTVPPTLSLSHYEPVAHGPKLKSSDNFVAIKTDPGAGLAAHDTLAPNTFYIRYRGCMDTFGLPAATTSVDTYFKSQLGVRFVDLEKKMCCGFPFEADGLHERAKKAHMYSLIEIAKCIARLMEEWRKGAPHGEPKFVLFSNCPTCCEAIRDFKNILKNPEKLDFLKSKASLPSSFNLAHLNYQVKDTAEIAVELLGQTGILKSGKSDFVRVDKTVGLKVPCHNTKSATEAQMSLLKMYYSVVESYDNCCGLSGTSRLKKPKIGTQIAENLFDQIRAAPTQTVVSGCPSCRDGVKIQQGILQAKMDSVADFEIKGIFQQIVSDLPATEGNT
jgi:Fe-S oxidoreductase